jgi:hypothetical protein
MSGRTALLMILFFLAKNFTCEAQTRSVEDITRGIQRGDPESIHEAGRTGNQALLPGLRAELKEWDDDPIGDALRLALAKLGDTHELQRLFCRAERSVGQSVDSQTVEYVGGGFWVRTLATLLDRDAEFDKVKLPESFDTPFHEPSWLALMELPKLVANPPTKGEDFVSKEQRKEEIKLWHNWIDSHQAEIESMQPNGEGVIFSKAGCRQRK